MLSAYFACKIVWVKRWPLNNAYFWETAPFFRLLLPFAAGILFYDYGWLHLQGSAGIGISAMALLLFILAIFFAPAIRVLHFVLVTTLLFCLGNAFSWFNDTRNDSSWFGSRPTTDHCSPSDINLVRISDEPELRPAARDDTWRIPVNVVCRPGLNSAEWVAGKAILYIRNENNAKRFHKGDTLTAPANWERIKNAGNPFEFDYATHCAHNGLYYRQFADPAEVSLYAPHNPASLSLTEKAHNWCTAQFEKYIPSAIARGLVDAMMLGDEVNLDQDMREAYAETGIIHIIAISGGNVAVFFVIVSGLLWWLRDKRHRWVKYAIALPLVWFYVVMAGSSPSAIRAAAMFSLIAFAVLFQKNSNSLNSVLATAFILLCAQPMWLFSPGFQLSFLAVLSLILFYRHVRRWWAPSAWVAQQLWSVVAASIAAQILVAPLIIYYFHSFPLMFIIANAAAYLFMGLVLILSILILALSWIPALATAVGTTLAFSVEVFGKIISGLQYMSPASFRALLLTGSELLLVYIIVAGMSTFLIRKRKLSLFAALGASCVLVFSSCISNWQRLTQNRLVVYNISGENYSELIRGNKYQPLTQYHAHSARSDYALTPVHINYQTPIRDTTPPAGIYEIAGKRVLIPDRPVTSGHFPADVLVINYTGTIDPAQLKQVFSPGLVVLGANYPRQLQQQMVNAFHSAGIRIHAVGQDGAYVLSN